MNFQVHFSCIAVAAWSVAGLPAVSLAAVGDQIARIQPADSEPGDGFGFGLAIKGDLVLVGAAGDRNDEGEATGSAYLFDISDPANPVEIAHFFADDGVAGDQFGWRATLGDGVAFITAMPAPFAGSIYAFDISDPANPIQLTRFRAEVDGEDVGIYRSNGVVEGGILLVGAPDDDPNGTNSGSAFLFDVSNPAKPVQLARLVPDDGATFDRFGAVPGYVDGDVVVVGAWLDDDNGGASGSAYVFDISDPTNPVQLAKLVASDGGPVDEFGITSNVNGNLAVFEARMHDHNGDNSGAAYLFDISDPANPVETAEIPGTGEFDFRGPANVRDNLLVVGAPFDFIGGSISFYDVTNPSSPILIREVDGPDANAMFGNNGTGLDGGLALIRGQNADSGAGAVYLYDANLIPCPADLNGNRQVTFVDLLILLGDWGPCPDPPEDCPGDINGNGMVEFQDLLALLAAWGPCP